MKLSVPQLFGGRLFGSDNLNDLIVRVAHGDVGAFRALYRKTAPDLFAMTLKILPDDEIAAETLAGSFHKIRRYADRYAPSEADPMAWLFTIARNNAIDRRRASDVDWTDLEENGPFISADAAQAHPSLQNMSVQQRDILLDVYLRGYDIDDLRDATGMTKPAVIGALDDAMVALTKASSS